MPELRDHPPPVIRDGAGFNADKARSLLLKERQDLAAPQLPAHNSSVRRINPMDLKDVLREIKADRGTSWTAPLWRFLNSNRWNGGYRPGHRADFNLIAGKWRT
jgi:hypothetical protein